MGVKYKIEYNLLVLEEDLDKISNVNKRRIKLAIENKLTLRPDVFAKPLRANMKGLWSLRVGEYRIIFQIIKKVVKIHMIKHRSVVYDEMLRDFY